MTLLVHVYWLSTTLLMLGPFEARPPAQPQPLAERPSDATALPLHLESPDGKNRLVFDLTKDGQTVARIRRDGQRLLSVNIGLELSKTTIGSGLIVQNVERRAVDREYEVPVGKTSRARDHHRELIVSLLEERHPERRLVLYFRAFDDGIAFRYRIPAAEDSRTDVRLLKDERTSFTFAGDPTAWTLNLYGYTTSYENHYQVQPLSKIDSNGLVGLPLLLKQQHGSNAPIWMGITEAGLTDFAGMYLSRSDDGDPQVLVSKLSPLPNRSDGRRVIAEGDIVSPWRVIQLGDEIGSLLESDIVFHLNEPSRIADPSWIRPGQTTFPWWNGYALPNVDFQPGVNTATMKHYIDFCAKHGIPYHSLDGLDIAWYGGPIQPAGPVDVTTAAPSIDLPEVLRYAKQKGVRLRLWMHWKALQPQLDEAFATYERWGIEGVMIDFMNRDDQEMVQWYHEVARKAAEHRLTVTWHGAYKPTGMERTWPNVLSYEAVYNQEFNKWRSQGSGATPQHNVQVAFTRMLAGPLDYHQGGMRNLWPEQQRPQVQNPPVQGTRGHQLAMYVVYQNHLPMLADSPSSYANQPELPFLVRIPATWDETRVLDAQADSHLVIARRSGRSWYLGGMTANQGARLNLSLDFLPPGRHSLELYLDDAAAGPTVTRKVVQPVHRGEPLSVTMPQYGGFVGKIVSE